MDKTSIPTGQLAIPTFPDLRLWAISGAGLLFVSVGPSIVLDTSGQTPTLRAAVPERGTIVAIVEDPPTMTFPLPVAPVGTPAVYRNGVRLAPGIDYTVDGLDVTILPIQGLSTADIVLIDFYHR